MVVLRQDKPLFLEHTQRLPQRGTADTNYLRKLYLGEHRSGRNSPIENHLSQVRMYLRCRNFPLSRINGLEFHTIYLHERRSRQSVYILIWVQDLIYDLSSLKKVYESIAVCS